MDDLFDSEFVPVPLLPDTPESRPPDPPSSPPPETAARGANVRREPWAAILPTWPDCCTRTIRSTA